jgi:hypothetical protein
LLSDLDACINQVPSIELFSLSIWAFIVDNVRSARRDDLQFGGWEQKTDRSDGVKCEDVLEKSR